MSVLKYIILKILFVFLCFIIMSWVSSCRNNNYQRESVNVEYDQSAMNINGRITNNVDEFDKPKRLTDVDTISITPEKLLLIKNEGNNHFSLQIDLPNYDHSEVDRSILTWINSNLEYALEDSSSCFVNVTNNIGSQELKRNFNRKYEGDVFAIADLAHFYSNKHFNIYKGLQLGIDYDIKCRKIYESKDVVSFEILNFFCNYSTMDSNMNYTGATFFKYNGKMLTWAMFENSNVKDVLKTEVNKQFLKFPDDKYELFLKTSKYKNFTLPINPPYMTKDGLKFLYKKKELSDKEGNEQINCVVPIDNLNIMSSLASML